MIKVGGKDFIPFKCAGEYLGGYSATWLRDWFPRAGGPPRVIISPNKTGWYKSDLDAWLRKPRTSRVKKRAA